MNVLSRREPRADYDGIRLIVVDPLLAPSAERFFAEPERRLPKHRVMAPHGYAAFTKDVQQVLLWRQSESASPYNGFQLAVVVPPEFDLEADIVRYAAWLLYASGLFGGKNVAEARLIHSSTLI
jgi:hypothetical protein